MLWLLGCAPQTPHFPTQITLTDVAQDVGLEFQQSAFRWGMSGDPIAMMGGGLCWIDYDSDGWLDLYVVDSYSLDEAGKWQSEMGGLPTGKLFRNVDGTFQDVSSGSGTNVSMRGNGCISADFNQDSHPDLYVTTARSNLLFWNNGDGTFTEGARDAGVAAYGWQTAAAAGDLNGDGWLDLFVAGYVDINNKLEESTMGFPNTHYALRDLLYLSSGGSGGTVTFTEVGELIGLEAAALEYGLGASLKDFDGDGRLDLFVANDTNPNRLYLNQANDSAIGFQFTEVGATAAIDDTNSGMGVAAADYDGDGQDDIFVTNMGEQVHSLYENDSAENNPTFTDTVASIGVEQFGVGWTGWGTTWADFDLDGDLDLTVVHGGIPVLDLATDGQRMHLYLNQTAQGAIGQFAEAGANAGLNAVGPLIGRGSAVADFDNDGDPDIAINTIAGPLRLLRNDGNNGNWLAVSLGGLSAGARVQVELPDGTLQEQQMQIGSSYLASEDPRCLLGLGGATRVKRLTVTWPDGRQLERRNLQANQLIELQPPQN